MNGRSWIVAASLLIAAPATAQTAPAPAAPAVDATPLDPARVAAARPVIDKLVPVGTYRRMMGSSMEAMMQQMMGQMGDLPIREIAGVSGLSDDKVTALGDTTLNQVMAIYDPHWHERTDAVMHAMFGSMGELMDSMEPGIREGLVHAYARTYTADQLAEMGRFFATPTGSLYAANSMPMFLSPEMMREMQRMMPELMKRMPAMMEAAKKATAALPPPRKIEELSAADRTQLAKLLGVAPGSLREPKRSTP